MRIIGMAPMLMHAVHGVNPFHPLRIEINKLTKKRNKTEEDLLNIMDLEYKLSIYYDDSTGPYIPAQNVEACLRDAAKKRRLGQAFTSSVFVTPDMIPLQYEGPHDLEGLVKDMRFRDVRPVVIKKQTVLRCRPRFNKWEATFTLLYDATVLDRQNIIDALDTAGRLIGINDGRPRYGRFAVVV